MRVCCPECKNAFEYHFLEEVLNPTVSIIRRTKDRSSWQDVIDLVRMGCSYRLFNVGDVIAFQLKDGTNFEMEVAGIDIYSPNTVVLVAKNCLPQDRKMNELDIYGDTGGWSKCQMRSFLNDTFYKLLPDDFQSIIIPRTITQKIEGTEYSSKDKLWIPSQTEMFANQAEEIDVGDKHFPLYSSEKSRIKMRIDGSETLWYWLRTPNSSYGYDVRSVNPTGCLNLNNAFHSNGVAPVCIIGDNPNNPHPTGLGY